ncbi:MAG TPA: rhomboid family intramembrane serine protease [Hyphomicrobiaceae bacterium]|nr:rhomboid family intramembrane serine protease [Hyphomicrobiaceae bacterium]
MNVPASIVWMLAILALVHVGRDLLSVEDDAWLVRAMGFIPARYTQAGHYLPGGATAAVTSLLTHMLLHGDLTHLLVNGAWLLAVGSPLARRIGTLRLLGLGLLSGFAGALTFLAVNPDLAAPVVGASGAISGLMGALFRLLFAAGSGRDRHLLREEPWNAPRLGLRATFADRRALAAVMVWIVLNLVFAFWLRGLLTDDGIAWEAHIGGFLAGLLTFGAFDTGPVKVSGASAQDQEGPST